MIRLPKEILLHFNEIYLKAERDGMIIAEYGYSQASSNNFLGAFGGFVYIKPSFQCQQSLTLPQQPYLIGLLVHKWEVVSKVMENLKLQFLKSICVLALDETFSSASDPASRCALSLLSHTNLIQH